MILHTFFLEINYFYNFILVCPHLQIKREFLMIKCYKRKQKIDYFWIMGQVFGSLEKRNKNLNDDILSHEAPSPR